MVKSKRKSVKELTTEEFFSCGLDSDISSGEEDEARGEEEEKNSSLKSAEKTSKHKEQLLKLENKDPEFYKFLQENEPELLDFDESEDSFDEYSSEDEDNEKSDEKKTIEKKKKKKKKKEKDVKDSEMEEDSNEEEEVGESKESEFSKEGENVTIEMLQKLKKGLEKNSLFSLRRIMRIFHAAVMEASDDDNEKESNAKFNFKIESSSVFNSLVQICLKSVSNVLQHHLTTEKMQKRGKKMQLPSTCKSWSKVKVTVKCYLKDLLQLLRQLAEPDMLAVILRHVNDLCLYYACFPKLTKMLVKRLVRMWSSAEEHVRVLAFITIRKISLLVTQLFDFILKQLYVSFVKNAKFLTPSSKPAIVFMQNSLVEMFSIDHNMTYQYGFIYIRQMAIHLRNAISMKKKDSYQSVYNWQYIICIQLWCRVLADLHSNTLAPLIYPLVQVTLGVIRLIPTARFYPLRFHCIQSLNVLSKSTDTYIPVASYLIEILECSEFNRRAKQSMATLSDLSCLLKLPKAQLHTRSFQDTVIDNVCQLLLEHFVTHSTSIAFPELIFPVCLRLKRFMKKTEAVKFRKQTKQIVDKLQEAGHEVLKKRSTVNFSPKDIEEVRKWELLYGEQKNSLQKFYETWLKMKATVESNSQPRDNEDYESDEEEVKGRNKRKKMNQDHKSEKPNKKMKNFKEIALNNINNEKDDLIEDFELSSDDE